MKKRSLKRILVVNVLVALLFCFFSGCTGTEGEEPVGSGTINKTYDKNKSEILQPVFSDRGGFYANKMVLRKYFEKQRHLSKLHLTAASLTSTVQITTGAISCYPTQDV